MPTLFVRAYRPAGDPDALGDVLTLAELAELRLSGPGERPTPEQTSRLVLRMLDQASIERLVTVQRRTRLPAKPVPATYLWEIGLSDHYRVDKFFQGESRIEPYQHVMGPTPIHDAVAITFPPDRIEEVVTRQAARSLRDFDPQNWTDASLARCNADNHLSVQEQLDRLGVSMTIEEFEALKTEPRKKNALNQELGEWLRSAGYGGQKLTDIMDKKTLSDYPWVRLADTGRVGYYYRPLLLKLFELMLPSMIPRRNTAQPGSQIHLIEPLKTVG